MKKIAALAFVSIIRFACFAQMDSGNNDNGKSEGKQTMRVEYILEKMPELIYEHLLDFKKFGSLHPYMKQVEVVGENSDGVKEYHIIEEVRVLLIFKMHPSYNATVTEIEKGKHIRYYSKVRRKLFLTIDLKLEDTDRNILVVEEFAIEGNKFTARLFARILKKAHQKVFENMRNISSL